jgi:iron complex outermembrane recepter protein
LQKNKAYHIAKDKTYIMKKIPGTLFILLLSVVAITAKAQTLYTINGKVTDTAGKPVKNATIELRNIKDSTLVKTDIADAEGTFKFLQVKAGAFILFVSSTGYEQYFSNVLEVNGSNTQINYPPVILKTKSVSILQGVTVTARKPFLEQKIDRTVMNVDALITNAGSSAIEALEKAPGVLVSSSGQISLKGKSGVVIYINDKPSYLSAAELINYLRGLPASTIEVIEIMPNPPAKYDAAGSAGVINIRLKKSRVKGFNGNLSLSYGQGTYMRTNNSFNFNYRVNKVNFFGNTSYNINNDYQDLRIERQFFTQAGALASTFSQRSYDKRERNSSNIRFGLDYYMSKKSTLGIVIDGFDNPFRGIKTNDASMLNNSFVLDSTVKAVNETTTKWRKGSGNVNYSLKLDSTGKELSMNLDYIRYKTKSDQELLNTTYLPNNTVKAKDILTGNLPAVIDIHTAKIDYTQPLKKSAFFDAGLKTSFIKTNNTAEYYSGSGSSQVINNDFTNYFNYREYINAAYINYKKEFKRFSLQTGLRFENTLIKGRQLGNAIKPDSSFKREYSSFFPTVYLSYRLDSASRNQVAISYGRRINRPDYQDMNPFVSPVDKFTFFSGNPFLVPTFSQSFSVSHIFRNAITTSFEYSVVRDVINETVEQTNGIFISRPGNIGRNTNIGFSLSGGLPVRPWWSVYMYMEYTNIRYKGVLYNQQLDTKADAGVFYATNQFKISKLWDAELFVYYQTSRVNSQFSMKSIWIATAGVQRKVLKEKGAVKFNLRDIFYSVQPRGTITNLLNSTATYFNYLDNRVFTISLTYRFSTGKSLNARQSGGAETEQGRVKSN